MKWFSSVIQPLLSIIVVYVAYGGDFLPAQIDEVAFNMRLSCRYIIAQGY